MQTYIAKKLEKIHSAFCRIHKNTKKVIKYGTQLSLLVLSAGTVMLYINQTLLGFDPYIKFISTSLIKSSFTILAEVIIGGLLVDYIFNNR